MNFYHYSTIKYYIFLGNGSGFAGPIVRFVRGDWQPSNQEIVKPSVATKLCFFAAIALTLVPDQDFIYLAIVGLFITVKLSSVFQQPVDPFKPIESIFWGIVNGITFEGRVKDDWFFFMYKYKLHVLIHLPIQQKFLIPISISQSNKNPF